MWLLLQGAASVVILFLADSMKGLVGRALVALGIGAVTTVGFNAVIASATARMAFTGVPAQMYNALDAMGVVWFLSILVSAISTRLLLKGLSSDSMSFWALRRGLPAR